MFFKGAIREIRFREISIHVSSVSLVNIRGERSMSPQNHADTAIADQLHRKLLGRQALNDREIEVFRGIHD